MVESIGSGHRGDLPLSKKTVNLAEKQDINIIREPTPQAIDTFLEKKGEGKIGAVFHIAC